MCSSSGCDLQLQADGTATLVPQPDTSPQSLADIFNWPEHMLKRLDEQGLLQNLVAKQSLGINLYTDWSGMGAPESSLHMVNEALARRGLGNIPVRSIRATDIDPSCRRVMLAYSEGRPCHVFHDIRSRVPIAVLEKLEALTGKAQAELKRKLARTGKMDAELRDLLGEQLVLDMCNILKQVEFTNLSDYCDCHAQHCPIWGAKEDLLESGLGGAIVGNECLDWTSEGLQLEFCGFGLIPLLVWCFETLARKPAFVIEECTPRFKSWVLEHVFGTLSGGRYSLQSRVMSPTHVGIPVSRPRQWCILLDNTKLKPVLPFDSVACGELFFRQMSLDGSIFFTKCGGPGERQKFKRWLLYKRGLYWRDKKMITGKKNSQLLAVGHKVRLARYKKLAQSIGVRRGIVDVGQDPNRRTSISGTVPTLLRRSLMVELESEELLLPSVHFDVMGFPLHRPEGVDHKCLFSGILHDLSYAEMRNLCGNAMHTSMVGLCILYIAACTTLVSNAA